MRPLWLKIGVGLALATLTVALISGALSRKLETDFLQRILEQQSQRTASLIGVTAVDAIISEDKPVLETVVEQAGKADQSIHALTIFNEKGVALAAWQRSQDLDEESSLTFNQPVRYEGDLFGEVRVVWNTEPQRAQIHRHVERIRWFVVGALVVLSIVIVLLVRWLVIRHVLVMSASVERIAAGDLTTRVDVATNDELGRLAQRLNEMVANLAKASESLQRTNAALQRVAYATFHDLTAPALAIDHLSAWLAEDLGDKLDEDSRQHLSLLQERGRRMKAMVDDLATYALASSPGSTWTEVDLDVLARDIFQELQPAEGFTLRTEGELPLLHADHEVLRFVMWALLDNAVTHHHLKQGVIEVAATTTATEHHIVVKDDGPGIEERYQDRVFELFFRLKRRDEVEGSGLGLCIVQQLVEGIGGRTWLESAPDEGSAFWFSWPKPPA